VGDINGDGREELVVGDGMGFVWVYPLGPRGKNRDIGAATFIRTFFGDCTTISLADWDNNGTLDIVSGNSIGLVAFVRNRGNGVFVTADNKPMLKDADNPFPLVSMGANPIHLGNYTAPCAVDWDRDGRNDLIVGDGSYSANAIYLFRNTGSPHAPVFSPSERYWLVYGMGKEHLTPAVGDLDGDGGLDVVFGERIGCVNLCRTAPRPPAEDRGEAFLLEFAGPITFGNTITNLGPMVRPALTDWDGDGDLDLLLGLNDGRVHLAENTGTAQEARFAAPAPLRARDVLKPYPVPGGWSISHTGDSETVHRHSGAYLQILSETDDEGRARPFMRYSFFSNYVCSFAGATGIGAEFTENTMYTVVATVRARNTDLLRITFRHSETAHRGSDTLAEGSVGNSVELKASASWQTVHRSFRFKTAFGRDRIRSSGADTIRAGLSLQVHGTPEMQVDFASLTLEERGAGKDPDAGADGAPNEPAPTERTP
ncbi:VCBS repeat-containing protein, partial [bacterium]|nr:VCBS repeat-containing protein [bacterium]